MSASPKIPRLADYRWSRRPIAVQATERQCRRCGIVKPLAAFNRFKSTSRKTGETVTKFYGPCKPCKAEEDARRYHADPEAKRQYARDRRRAGHCTRKRRRRAYVETLGAACMACGSIDGRLCIDHDHQTGAVRGVLCNQCNTALGLLREDVDRLRALERYIETRCGRSEADLCLDS